MTLAPQRPRSSQGSRTSTREAARIYSVPARAVARQPQSVAKKETSTPASEARLEDSRSEFSAVRYRSDCVQLQDDLARSQEETRRLQNTYIRVLDSDVPEQLHWILEWQEQLVSSIDDALASDMPCAFDELRHKKAESRRTIASLRNQVRGLDASDGMQDSKGLKDVQHERANLREKLRQALLEYCQYQDTLCASRSHTSHPNGIPSEGWWAHVVRCGAHLNEAQRLVQAHADAGRLRLEAAEKQEEIRAAERSLERASFQHQRVLQERSRLEAQHRKLDQKEDRDAGIEQAKARLAEVRKEIARLRQSRDSDARSRNRISLELAEVQAALARPANLAKDRNH